MGQFIYPPTSIDVPVTVNGQVVGQVATDGVSGYGQVANYDKVRLAGVDIPIITGTLRGGTSLFVEHRKVKGADFAKYTSQGKDVLPIGFTLHLFIDYSKNPPLDWKRAFEKIESRLIPRDIDLRNAIDIYHPSYAAKGIHKVIPTADPVLNPVGVDRWTYDFQGIDARFIGQRETGASKAIVNQADIRTTGKGAVTNGNIQGPEARVKGAALRRWK